MHPNARLAPPQVWARALGCGLGLALIAGCTAGHGAAPSPTSTATPTSTTSSAATPSAAPAAAPHLARSVPVRLEVPAIGVDSTLMSLGLKTDGTMEVPPDGFPAGWYTGAPTPGELGPAIIAGHVDWNGPGVFYRLDELAPGDAVYVTREDGSIVGFRVTQVSQFPKDAFPTDLVYGNIAGAGLRLITCGGSFNTKTHHYDDNIVVFADFITPGS